MPTARRAPSLTIDATWLLTARTISFVVSLALPLFLVRRLDQTEFGLYKQAFLFVNSAVAMVPLGFGMSALYFVPRDPAKRGQTVLNTLLFNLLVGASVCVALILRPSIVRLIFGGAQLETYAAALGILILFWTTASSFDLIAIAFNDVRTASGIIILIQLTRTLFVLGAGLRFGTVKALLWAAVIQGVCQSVGFVLYLNLRAPSFWQHFDGSLMRRQLSYALPLGAAGLLYTLQNDLPSYFVSRRFGPALYAIYAIGTTQLPLLNMLQESANSVLIPRVSLLQRNQESREILHLLTRAMRKLAAAYLPICAFLLVVGPEVIRFLFTDRYRSAWPIFAVNVMVLPLSIVLLDPLYRAYADQRYFLIRVRIVLVMGLILFLWFGTSHFGLVGAIAAVVAVNLLERVVMGIRFGRVLRIAVGDINLVKDLGRIAIAAAGAALVTILIRAQMTAARPLPIIVTCGVAFAALYVAGILLLKVPSPEEKKAVLDRFVRLQRL